MYQVKYLTSLSSWARYLIKPTTRTHVLYLTKCYFQVVPIYKEAVVHHKHTRNKSSHSFQALLSPSQGSIAQYLKYYPTEKLLLYWQPSPAKKTVSKSYLVLVLYLCTEKANITRLCTMSRPVNRYREKERKRKKLTFFCCFRISKTKRSQTN